MDLETLHCNPPDLADIDMWLQLNDTYSILPMHVGYMDSLQWRHNEYDGISNQRRRDGLLKRLFRRR